MSQDPVHPQPPLPPRVAESPAEQPYGPSHDQEQEVNLAEYWSLVVRGRKIIAASVSIALAVSFVMFLLSPPLYRARTVLKIEAPRATPFDVGTTTQVYAKDPEFLPTQTSLLKSREMAARVVEKLNLAENKTVKPPDRGFLSSLMFWESGSDAPAAVDPELVAEGLMGGVEANPIRGTSLVEVAYVAGSPQLAADVANGVATAYIDWTMESKFEVLGQASQFLGAQIEQLKADIDRKSQQLAAYSDQKDIVSMDPGTNSTLQNLASLNQDYSAAVSDRVSKEARYHETMTASPDAIADSASGGNISQIRGDVSKLEREYAEKLNLFKPEWPAMQQLKAQIEKGRQHLSEEISRQVSGARELARADYLTALRREENLKAALGGQKSEAMTLNRNAVEYTNLKVEVETKRALLDNLLKRQAETQVASRMRGEQTSTVRVVDRALPPRDPFKPSVRQNLMTGLAFGIGFGLLIIFLQEYLDRSLKSPEQVDRYLHLPALGVIPSASTGGKMYGLYHGFLAKRKQKRPAAGEAKQEFDAEGVPKQDIELLPHRSRRSTIAEAYRAFRTALLLSQAGGVQSMVITSSLPSEGKTSTAVNLATVLGQLGRRVLLIDADLHKPRMHELFRVSNRKGLVSILAEGEDPTKVLVSTAVQGVYLLPAGPSTPNPSGLLSSEAMARFLELAREKFDHIIIDTPPVSPISDALILGALTDGVVLCVKAGETPRELVARVRDTLRRSNVRILGVLLNNLQADASGYDKYYYYYRHYGQPEGEGDDAPESVPFVK